jgi:hypothetical protein
LQLEEAIGHPLGRFDDALFPQYILIGDGLQPPPGRGAQIRLLHTERGRRIVQPLLASLLGVFSVAAH